MVYAGDKVTDSVRPNIIFVLADEGGKEMRSIEFADYMKRKMNTVNKRLVGHGQALLSGKSIRYVFYEKKYKIKTV